MKKFLLILTILLTGLLSASAETATFTMSGLGTGKINGTVVGSLSSSPITITLIKVIIVMIPNGIIMAKKYVFMPKIP